MRACLSVLRRRVRHISVLSVAWILLSFVFKSTSDPSPAQRAPFVCRALWGFDSNFLPVNVRGGSYRCSSAGSEGCVMLTAADKTLFLALIASDRWHLFLRKTSYTLSPGQLYCPQRCTSAYNSQCVSKASYSAISFEHFMEYLLFITTDSFLHVF